MSQWSLSRKLLILSIAVGLVVPVLGAFSYFQATKTAEIQNQIADHKLAKTAELGELVFKFRDIRIQIRTVPVRGMSWSNIDDYLGKTKTAVASFLEAKKRYQSRIENEEERSLYQAFDLSSQDFLAFGNTLLTLSSAHDPAKLEEVAKLVREVCPVKAEKVERAIGALIEQQSTEAHALVSAAHQREHLSNLAILVGAIFGFGFAVGLGQLVARSISRGLQALADQLSQSSRNVTSAAKKVSANGNTLSAAATQQAAALQQTASAIEEISSMISRNSENARKSSQTASSSLATAQQGKEMVEELVVEVEQIHRSTVDFMTTVENGNQEIGKIVNVINEIESKTKVINDIVFQTKLLSFNASVEAARAGESGKGFAVVAEEIGNLASLSGRSAKEISELLSNSVEMVQKTIASTHEKTRAQADESRSRVDRGIAIGKRCATSLAEILDGAQKVHSMVSEISTASHEQSTGVEEVTKAIHLMDGVTQENAEISGSSAAAADELNSQAVQMKSLVDRLYETIRGRNAADQALATATSPGPTKAADKHPFAA